ncbi:MAG: hypothetical protein KDB23_33905, partial [Planctomycetales bacterium]|nr:hypothetical protein [Planctomycetales bacterium]
ISEVHYNPSDPSPTEIQLGFDSHNDFEFVELLNTSDRTIVLAGAHFAQADVGDGEEGIEFEFAQGAIQSLAPGERLLVVEDRAAFEARYGTGLPIAGEWAGTLNDNNELLTVLGYDGSTIVQFRYDDSGDWPSRADGLGSSLELAEGSSQFNDAASWFASVPLGGTPGAAPVAPIGVVINEVLSHTDPPLVDSIELYNPTTQVINVSGWYLSDAN